MNSAFRFASQRELCPSHSLSSELLMCDLLEEFIQLTRPWGTRAGNSHLTQPGRHAEIWPHYGFQSLGKAHCVRRAHAPPAACHWVLVTDGVGSSLGKVPRGLSPNPLGSNEQSPWLPLELQELGKDCLGGNPQKDAQKGSRKTSCSHDKVHLRYSSPFF